MSFRYEFPLSWPQGWKRTDANHRFDAPFKVTSGQAINEMIKELERMNARDVCVSSDQPLNKDRSISAVRRGVTDPGVAVYFNRKGRTTVLACDKYAALHDNMRSIGKTVEAMRGIERWGASDMLDRAFTGFEALAAPPKWWEVLGLTSATASEADISAAFRRQAAKCHPDKPTGSHQAMASLNAARDEGLAKLAAHQGKGLVQ